MHVLPLLGDEWGCSVVEEAQGEHVHIPLFLSVSHYNIAITCSYITLMSFSLWDHAIIAHLRKQIYLYSNIRCFLVKTPMFYIQIAVTFILPFRWRILNGETVLWTFYAWLQKEEFWLALIMKPRISKSFKNHP